MHSIFDRKWLSSVFTQMLIVVVAFTIMCISSYLFVSNIEHKHLIKEAENALHFAGEEINAKFLENETFLINFARTVQNMNYRSIGKEMIQEYVADINNFLVRDNQHMRDLTSIYAYFFNWGGEYVSGNIYDENFNPHDQPWLKAAVEANGNIVITEKNSISEAINTVATLSYCLMDDEGEPMAVICIDIDLERIINSAVTINLSKGSYGLLLNKKLQIIAHPQGYLRGQYLYNVNSNIANISSELELGRNISERRVKNYMSEDSIVYFMKISYDWFLGIVIPVHEYYNNMYNMAAFMIVLGIVLSLILCTMLYQISKAKQKADVRTQQKSNFLATMSHEIRTPLNAILGMTEIQMQNTDISPSASEAFLRINNSGNLLLNIINDILDLSKIEAGKLELMPLKYEFASLLNDVVQLNYIRFENKPIEFVLEINENIPSILVGDELRIKQILNNLLSNAFKYTYHGKVVLSSDAECIGRGGAVLVTLVFEIRDTGQGMTQEQVNKLFNEYTRFNMEANRTTEGTGLGMTITQNLINLMHGKMSIKSAVGEGTTVKIRLPQRTDGFGIKSVLGKEMVESLKQFKLGNTVNLKKAHIKHEYMPYGKVLIVDDVETNLYVAKGLMAPYGLDIDLATSGYEAIEKIKKGNTYDIVFMDHMMPKMDGVETTKILREMGYTQPIVALTANALAGQAEIFLKSGFDVFISKPIDVRQLNTTLTRLIRDKQPQEVLDAAQMEKSQQGRKQYEAGQEIDSQLAEIFARDAGKTVKVLKTLLQNNFQTESEIKSYIINVHAMKSALANIGEVTLSTFALRLEQAGRENNINVMISETQNFINDLNKIIDEIRPKDTDTENVEDTEEALAYLLEKLEIIKEACISFDKKTVKDALKEIREKTWSHNTREMLDKISEHLLHSDFDNAASIAENFISTKRESMPPNTISLNGE